MSIRCRGLFPNWCRSNLVNLLLDPQPNHQRENDEDGDKGDQHDDGVDDHHHRGALEHDDGVDDHHHRGALEYLYY